MSKPVHRTMDEFLSHLERQNKTLSQWAKEQKFSLDVVYSVTRGKALGKRGDARRVYLAMGLQPATMYACKGA